LRERFLLAPPLNLIRWREQKISRIYRRAGPPALLLMITIVLDRAGCGREERSRRCARKFQTRGRGRMGLKSTSHPTLSLSHD